MLTENRLKELLHYNPKTGTFRRRCSMRQFPKGSITGHEDHGYIWIYIDGKRYSAHRLAWFYMMGRWPKLIDHINRKKSDNRFLNLREATKSQNALNHGKAGVTWHKIKKRWQAQVKINYEHIHIGTFKDRDAAIQARQQFLAQMVSSTNDRLL